MKTILSKNEKETIKFGKKLGGFLKKGDIIALCGELGSGKTVLAKGIAEGLGVKKPNSVNSPSFVIIKEYIGKRPMYHFDIYRLNNISELFTVDYNRYFYGDGVCVIEWADKIIQLLPKDFLRIDLSIAGENKRKITVVPHGERYKTLPEKL